MSDEDVTCGECEGGGVDTLGRVLMHLHDADDTWTMWLVVGVMSAFGIPLTIASLGVM